MLDTLLIVILIALLVGAALSIPSWRHSRHWGYGTSSVLTILFVVILAVVLIRLID